MDNMEDKFQLPKRFEAETSHEMWREYRDLLAKYKPIDLGLGCSDYAPSKIISVTLANVSKDQEKDYSLQQYSRDFGHPRLVNAISKVYSKLINQTIDPETEMVITFGAHQALYCAISGHINPNDEVIIIEPYYDCYVPMVKAAGGVPKFISLKPKGNSGDSNDWSIDYDELEKMFGVKTKMMILNTPHNSLGKIFSRSELEALAELCKKWNVICVSDEVYEWVVFPGQKHLRICTLPGMWERTITIGSAGKTFNATGWKTGWAYGPSNLIRNLQIVYQNSVSSHLTPIQETLARIFEEALPFLNSSQCRLSELGRNLVSKRDFLNKILKEVGFKPILSHGGYFIMADWTKLENKFDLNVSNENKDFQFTKWLSTEMGILAIPITVFYSQEHKSFGENYIRFCFVKDDQTLQKASEILSNWKCK